MSVLSRLLSRATSWIRRVSAPAGSEQGGHECDPRDLVPLERPRFFVGQLITAEDLTLAQDYVREKQRRHNRLLHGWGVVCGLEVDVTPAGGSVVQVSPGYALSPTGDEIVIPEAVRIDVHRARFVAVRYAEQAVGPTPASANEDGIEHSRTRESFELRALKELPAPDDQWVILAGVTIAAGKVSLDPRHRRLIVSPAAERRREQAAEERAGEQQL